MSGAGGAAMVSGDAWCSSLGDPVERAAECVAEVAGMGLDGVQFIAGLAERCFDGVEASFQLVDARRLPRRRART